MAFDIFCLPGRDVESLGAQLYVTGPTGIAEHAYLIVGVLSFVRMFALHTAGDLNLAYPWLASVLSMFRSYYFFDNIIATRAGVVRVNMATGDSFASFPVLLAARKTPYWSD